MARLCGAGVTLRNQCNAKWPKRSKISDGWIADAAHARRKSDHNPNAKGVVCALDITHDPAHGLDASKLAENLRLSADPRLNYVISNGRIANSGKPWRKYTGSNAHTKHCHVSFKQDAKLYDDVRDWQIDGVVVAPASGVPVAVPQGAPLLRKGSKGAEVVRLQSLLNAAGASPRLLVDGDFGPATLKAVIAYQLAAKLDAKGVVGAKTFETLEAKAKLPAAEPDFQAASSCGPLFDKLQAHYEQTVAKVYEIDGVLHAGTGHRLEHGQGFKVGDKVSQAQIKAWYEADKAEVEKKMAKHVIVKLNQNQYDAIASIIWNGGQHDDPQDKRDSPFYYKTPEGILANAVNAGDFDRVSRIIVALGVKPTASGAVFLGIKRRRLSEDECWRGVPIVLR